MSRSRFDMTAAEFRTLGHKVVDQIAGFYDSLPARPLTSACAPEEIRELLGTGGMPEEGKAAGAIFDEIAPLLFEHSLHNGHPQFLGYISAAGAPIGAMADLLAAAVNPNLAKWELSPVASEVEAQTLRWIAEFLGYPADSGGIMVSGGNMANLHAFIVARHVATNGNIRKHGIYGEARKLTVYASTETHTWIEKAAELCGLGSSAIRWIDTDDQQRMNLDALRETIDADRRDGYRPFLIVGNAGTVSTGAIDPLCDMASYCREQDIWFHVDGAYGAPAASLVEAPADLKAISAADSLAIDPHKWLYSPIEAACLLTRNPDVLRETFDFQPDYYQLDDADDSPVDYYRQGLQNTRGFRALKVWTGLRHAGAGGYRKSIRQNIALARHFHRSAQAHRDIEARTQNLSITTFRYVPIELDADNEHVDDYINELNKALLVEIQASGDAFISNAIINGDFVLRVCVVNFRTTEADIDAVINSVCRIGESLDMRMRPTHLAA
jgi:aromatic-L-amino-acid decarboxylase